MKRTSQNWRLTLAVIGLAATLSGAYLGYMLLRPTTDLLRTTLGKNLPTAQATQETVLKDGDTFDLRAAGIMNEVAGKVQPMLAYNGSIPGPTIRVRQGDTVHVRFSNKVPMDTTVHAHGLREDFKMDGIPGISQAPIKQNGNFTYNWTFPDAGIYWYHPHVREDYQQGSGLYGAIIVEPKVADYWPAADSNQPIILSDALTNPTTGLLQAFSAANVNHTLMGRYGNALLVNGRQSWATNVQAGTVQRFYVLNASSARPYRLAFDGYRLKVVGSDNGRVGQEYWADGVTLNPGERVVVDVLFDKAGRVNLINTPSEARATLGTINVLPASTSTAAAQSFAILRSNIDVASQIKALPSQATINKRLELQVQMSMDSMGMGGSSGGMGSMMSDSTMMGNSGSTIPAELAGIEWSDRSSGSSGMEGKWQIVDQDTKLVNDKIRWSFNKGDVVRITINNTANNMHPMQHPIHIHGQRFAVASINGQPNPNLDWKDTVSIPSGQTYELLVVMDNPGSWMLHCHISEHLESGMALNFNVR